MTKKIPNSRLPCGNCGMETTKLPGSIVPKGIDGVAYHVCWKCDLCKQEGSQFQWTRLSAAKQKKPQWTKYTSTHWQTKVNGQILDYWPTKRKWRFGQSTHVGDVNRFIREIAS